MQIHEITLVQEGLGDIAKTIGSDIKSAVTAPFQKAKAVLNTPGAMTSARGYGDAMDKYYQGQVGQQKQQQQQADLTAWAKNLSAEWLKQPRPSPQTPAAQAQPAVTAPAPKPTVAPAAPAANTAPISTITKSNSGLPNAAEYEKLQQRIAAAAAKQPGPTNEAFADLPGAKPTAGGAVAPTVTARPAGIKAPPPLQSRYAQNFKTWAASKVADRSSGLGLADVEKIPDISRGLNQALAKVVTTQQDPTANQAAVEQYLLMVGQAMQKLSAEQRATQPQSGTGSRVSAVTPLSSILKPNQIDALKNMAKNPTGAYNIKTLLGLT
jgi:hypothetical protein